MTMSSNRHLKPTPITDKNGTRTSRLKKPSVPGRAAKAAAPAASSTRLPLAPNPFPHYDKRSDLEHLATSHMEGTLEPHLEAILVSVEGSAWWEKYLSNPV
jgi:hypothetical protein